MKFRKPHGIYAGGGYGTASTFQSAEYDLLPDYNLSMFSTPERAIQWVKENAKKVGIEIE